MSRAIDIASGASIEDAIELAKTMRKADADECEASSGLAPLEAVLTSIVHSTECWTAYVGGYVLAMWGVVRHGNPLGPRIGIVWLLTSEEVEANRRVFWSACKIELRRLLEQWDMLVNAIDCRHVKAIRWGERLGLRFDEARPFGTAGLPFRQFAVKLEDLRV